MNIFDDSLVWWITAVELPALTALGWFILKTKSDTQAQIDRLEETLDVRTSQLREALMGFKLEVAKSYAGIADVKDLEARIVAHLLRIEAKLDRTALKAEALGADKT